MECNEKLNIHQINKLDVNDLKRKDIFPITVTSAVFDKQGNSLEALLLQNNSIFLSYKGSSETTRITVPLKMRRKGLIISYKDYDGNAITEKLVYDDFIADDIFKLDSSWTSIGDVIISGEISISPNGTWIIDGKDSGIKAVGPKGDNGLSPIVRTNNNKLEYSYDGTEWTVISDYVAAWFRFENNKIQISRDNKKTWTDLSESFTQNLYIKGYVTTVSALPTNATQGDIYMVGPQTSGGTDYLMYIKNSTGWKNNGSFTSITAGVVQELGDSETEVMSQKSITILSENFPNNGYSFDKTVHFKFTSPDRKDLMTPFSVKKNDLLYLEILDVTLIGGTTCNISFISSEETLYTLSYNTENSLPKYSVINITEDATIIAIRVQYGSGVTNGEIKARFASVYYATIIDNKNKVASLNKSLIDYFKEENTLPGYLTSTGGYSARANSICTTYINVKAGDKITYLGKWQYNDVINMVWGYPSKSTTGAIVLVASTNGNINSTFTIPDGINYIRAWSDTVANYYGLFYEGSINEDIKDFDERISKIEDSGIITSEPTKVTVQRNLSNYNSIRETIESLDATADNPYIVFIPKGEWFECDLIGKPYVTIVGESKKETIIYNDGTSSNNTPSDYSFNTYINTPLSDVPQNYKHVFFLRRDIHVKNLTVRVNDAKYCIHADNLGYKKVIFENCIFIANINVNYPVGIGTHSEQELLFDNCIFSRLEYRAAGIFIHNSSNQQSPTRVDIKNSQFNNCGFALIDELGSTQNDIVNINNCTALKGEITWYAEGNGTPDNIPYCINLNCLGSNVEGVHTRLFSGTSLKARANFEQYTISDNIKVIKGLNKNNNTAIFGIVNTSGVSVNRNYPLIGIIQNIIEDNYYIVDTGYVFVEPNNILGFISAGTKIYADEEGNLTTISNNYNPIAVFIENVASVYKLQLL